MDTDRPCVVKYQQYNSTSISLCTLAEAPSDDREKSRVGKNARPAGIQSKRRENRTWTQVRVVLTMSILVRLGKGNLNVFRENKKHHSKESTCVYSVLPFIFVIDVCGRWTVEVILLQSLRPFCFIYKIIAGYLSLEAPSLILG